jgi:hypothetical protein
LSARTPPGTPVVPGAQSSISLTPTDSLPPTPKYCSPPPSPCSPRTPRSPPKINPLETPEIPELLLPPAFCSSSPPVTKIQPIPLRSHPVRAEEPSSSNYRIQRLETAATVPPETAQVTPTVPRRTATLRQRGTRSGSRLNRLAFATEIPKQRRLWNCRLCSLNLTSAKAKYDHINGRRHKARIEAQQDHYCGHFNQKISSALDLERHIQGRRHLKVVSSRNH